jgi:hypothetical protein
MGVTPSIHIGLLHDAYQLRDNLKLFLKKNDIDKAIDDKKEYIKVVNILNELMPKTKFSYKVKFLYRLNPFVYVEYNGNSNNFTNSTYCDYIKQEIFISDSETKFVTNNKQIQNFSYDFNQIDFTYVDIISNNTIYYNIELSTLIIGLKINEHIIMLLEFYTNELVGLDYKKSDIIVQNSSHKNLDVKNFNEENVVKYALTPISQIVSIMLSIIGKQ